MAPHGSRPSLRPCVVPCCGSLQQIGSTDLDFFGLTYKPPADPSPHGSAQIQEQDASSRLMQQLLTGLYAASTSICSALLELISVHLPTDLPPFLVQQEVSIFLSGNASKSTLSQSQFNTHEAATLSLRSALSTLTLKTSKQTPLACIIYIQP